MTAEHTNIVLVLLVIVASAYLFALLCLVEARRLKRALLAARLECDRLRAALRHQRNALVIVRDRQAGQVSRADIERGIVHIDAVLSNS